MVKRLAAVCPLCEFKLRRDFRFCPACGFKLDTDLASLDKALDRIRYLWRREGCGEFMYSNFKAVRDLGIMPYVKTKSSRPQLGDFEHILLLNLRLFSFLYCAPQAVSDFYKIGKLLGYYSTTEAIKSSKLKKLYGLLSKSGLYWKMLENDRIVETQKRGWEMDGGLLIDAVEVSKKEGRVKYTIKEPITAMLSNQKKSCCFLEMGALCGQMEALSPGFWDGVEKECVCMGDPHCTVEICHHETEENPKLEAFSKSEVDSVLDDLIDLVVKRGGGFRGKLGDTCHIAGEQTINYVLPTLSKGHKLLSRYSGRLVGERLAKKAEMAGIPETLDYLDDTFKYLRLGLLDSRIDSDEITIEMRESVYSSGMENIHKKLCLFPEGIIEGFISEASNENWIFKETKCLANGDECCEFQGKLKQKAH